VSEHENCCEHKMTLKAKVVWNIWILYGPWVICVQTA